jgi:hypothetical protein
MSKNRDDDYVATKVEQTFDDDGNTKVAEVPSTKKTNLNVIRQIGNKAGDKNFPTAKELLDSKQKPAKIIQLKPKD